MRPAITPGTHICLPSQASRLDQRKQAAPTTVTVCGEEFALHPGVYDTSGDTELMVESVALRPQDRFCEIGCGTGAVSILLAKRCAGGVAVDINPAAVANAKENAKQHSVNNVTFLESDGFTNVEGVFDVLICNPPYNCVQPRDTADRMFWDPDNEVKRDFFARARMHLAPGGRIYFGWADFADIDVNLPLALAEKHGFTLEHVSEREHKGRFCWLVLAFS